MTEDRKGKSSSALEVALRRAAAGKARASQTTVDVTPSDEGADVV